LKRILQNTYECKRKEKVGKGFKAYKVLKPPLSKKHLLPIESFGIMVQEENRSPLLPSHPIHKIKIGSMKV